MSFYPRYATVVILLATLPLGGCLFRTHRIEQTSSPVPLKAATKPELVAYMNSQAAKIQSMQATVDIDTAVGGAKSPATARKFTAPGHLRCPAAARDRSAKRNCGLGKRRRNSYG